MLTIEVKPLAHVAGFHLNDDLHTTREAEHEVRSGEGLDKSRRQHGLQFIGHLRGRATRQAHEQS